MIGKLSRCAKRLIIAIQEWRFGISSEGLVFLDKYGISEPGCNYYNASSYIRFRQFLNHVKIRPGQDVFLDFGSGKGRAVILAATYPFGKIIGIEFIEDLNAIARENVRKAMPKLVCRDIELITSDARAYQIPPDVTFIYIFHSFTGDVRATVYSNIRKSLIEAPRTITLLYMIDPGWGQTDEVKDHLPGVKSETRVSLSKDILGIIFILGPDV